MNGNEGFAFEIVKHIGVLATYQTGWKKELNIVTWNGKSPKYDIRDWDPTHMKMSRGITLTKEEMQNLMQCMLDSIQPASA